MEQVTLHGMWASPFYRRVQLALRLKGIPYNYVEEDLGNKSQELLQYNPIHKAVPVLVHQGKPIIESLLILEYIEDTWKDTPLMPQEPYLRSKVRFWCRYFEQMESSLEDLMFAGVESKAQAFQVLTEKVKVMEKGLEKDFGLGDNPFVHGERPGLLDVAVGVIMACFMSAFEEVAEKKLIYPEKTPTLFKWTCDLKGHPVVKEVLPDHDRLVLYLKQIKARVQAANLPKA